MSKHKEARSEDSEILEKARNYMKHLTLEYYRGNLQDVSKRLLLERISEQLK